MITRASVWDVVAKAIRVGKLALIQSGDHVDRWPLRRDDEVNPDRAGQLGQSHDLPLDLRRRGHHHVRQLVQHYDPVRHPFVDRRQRVVGDDVARPGFLQLAVAAVHLRDHDAQHRDDLIRFRDHVREGQVRRRPIVGQLNPLRVDKDQPNLLRRLLHQQRRDDRG